MKATLEIPDNLLEQAKQLALKERVPWERLVEEGLSIVLKHRHKMADSGFRPVTFKGNGLSAEFRDASWGEIIQAAYDRRIR